MVFWNTLLVLSAALLVASQSSSSAGTPTQSGVVLPSSTAGLDPCMETCFEEAAGANGCSIDDVNCACASAQLQADLTECMDAECSAFAAPQAQGLLAQLCNKVRVVATGTVTPGHLSLSSSSPSALPTAPVRNQQSSAPASMVLGAYLTSVAFTTAVMGPLVWGWM
ncbi:hypothetical protein B0H16DRAFT_219896 [Mycena metata]|uniref:CFEM domain-containing protein n=1 Tax=Mycena metata TaxID=1033252 RepID=A0AAD7JS38_9AGAR|nr:hypothetical protein B0H16DRAFT_219896 [Mycena metata]